MFQVVEIPLSEVISLERKEIVLQALSLNFPKLFGQPYKSRRLGSVTFFSLNLSLLALTNGSSSH